MVATPATIWFTQSTTEMLQNMLWTFYGSSSNSFQIASFPTQTFWHFVGTEAAWQQGYIPNSCLNTQECAVLIGF